MLWRSDLADIVLDDRVATIKALFTDALKNLDGRIRMGFKQADNIWFKGIELAGPCKNFGGV